MKPTQKTHKSHYKNALYSQSLPLEKIFHERFPKKPSHSCLPSSPNLNFFPPPFVKPLFPSSPSALSHNVSCSYDKRFNLFPKYVVSQPDTYKSHLKYKCPKEEDYKYCQQNSIPHNHKPHKNVMFTDISHTRYKHHNHTDVESNCQARRCKAHQSICSRELKRYIDQHPLFMMILKEKYKNEINALKTLYKPAEEMVHHVLPKHAHSVLNTPSHNKIKVYSESQPIRCDQIESSAFECNKKLMKSVSSCGSNNYKNSCCTSSYRNNGGSSYCISCKNCCKSVDESGCDNFRDSCSNSCSKIKKCNSCSCNKICCYPNCYIQCCSCLSEDTSETIIKSPSETTIKSPSKTTINSLSETTMHSPSDTKIKSSSSFSVLSSHNSIPSPIPDTKSFVRGSSLPPIPLIYVPTPPTTSPLSPTTTPPPPCTTLTPSIIPTKSCPKQYHNPYDCSPQLLALNHYLPSYHLSNYNLHQYQRSNPNPILHRFLGPTRDYWLNLPPPSYRHQGKYTP